MRVHSFFRRYWRISASNIFFVWDCNAIPRQFAGSRGSSLFLGIGLIKPRRQTLGRIWCAHCTRNMRESIEEAGSRQVLNKSAGRLSGPIAFLGFRRWRRPKTSQGWKAAASSSSTASTGFRTLTKRLLKMRAVCAEQISIEIRKGGR